MDGFFNWVRNVSYDIVALFIPGALFLVLAIFVSSGKLIFIEFQLTSISNPNDFSFLYILIFILISYVIGITLKSIASIGFIKDYYRKNLDDYGKACSDLYGEAKKKLEKVVGIKSIDTWFEFYVLTKTYVQTKGIPSTLTTYQNRYELCSSLSITFVLLFLEQLIMIIIDLCSHVDYVMPRSLFVGCVLCVVFLASAVLLKNTFRRYWLDLGSQVVAHAAVVEK
tara:strand:- start:14857 stop:15531 length:675 start_codon:yes stop_codon:yes gene_type:complete